MKNHKGMRPQDIAVLLKIVSYGEDAWLQKQLADDLSISKSEVCESLNRSVYADLLALDKITVNKKGLEGFLIYGIKYAFPAKPGTLALGMATAGYSPILKDYFTDQTPLVWPQKGGNQRGLLVEPLYPGAVEASKKDPMLYDLLALCDVFRVGEERTVKKAAELLHNILGQGEDYISC
jgi:hypothetical protein